MVYMNVGSRCALMLPQEFINPQKTPAKGLIVGEQDDRPLVLLEEVWHYKNNGDPYMTRYLDGSLRTIGWGWQAIIEFTKKMYVANPYPAYLKPQDKLTLTKMIQEAIEDFLYWR